MPQKKLHVCNKIGCNNLTKNRFCEKHQYIEMEEKKAINRKYNKTRTDDKEQAFYKSSGWKIVRKKALARDNYLCQDCLRMGYVVPAQTVHHIIPIKEQWSLRLIVENMVSLCESCHQQRHRKLNEGYAKAKMIMIKKQLKNNMIISIMQINEATEPPHTKSLQSQKGERRGELCKLFREIGKGGPSNF